VLKFVVISITSLLIFSCSHITPFGISDSYRSLLDQNTRSAKAYHDFETRLIVASTFKSKTFFESYKNEYALKYKLSEKAREEMFKDESERVGSNLEFVVSLYTPYKGTAPVGQKGAPWLFYLSSGDGRLFSPASVKKIERDDILSFFFPYVDDWSELYLVDFSREETKIGEGQPFSLIVTGAYGEKRLEW